MIAAADVKTENGVNFYDTAFLFIAVSLLLFYPHILIKRFNLHKKEKNTGVIIL